MLKKRLDATVAIQFNIEIKDFAKCMRKNIGRNISKNVSGECSQKLLDHAKLSATDALKTASKRAIKKQLK